MKDESRLWAALDGPERYFACAMLLKIRGFKDLPRRLNEWSAPAHERKLAFAEGLRALKDPRTGRHLAGLVDHIGDSEGRIGRIALRALIELREGTWRINYGRARKHPDGRVGQLAAVLEQTVQS
jgi:hypothetical protein